MIQRTCERGRTAATGVDKRKKDIESKRKCQNARFGGGYVSCRVYSSQSQRSGLARAAAGRCFCPPSVPPIRTPSLYRAT